MAEDDRLLNDLLGDDSAGAPPDELLGDGDEEPRLGTPSMPLSKEEEADAAKAASNANALMISFFAMVVVGTGNKIFQVLQFIPMYNYPLFVNMLTTAFYVPASFAYILPMIKYGKQITPQQQAVPKRVFAVMGLLDSIAGIMQSLSVNYIQNGSLVTLLMQSAIPVSMVISKVLLKAKYKLFQFVGAATVLAGLAVVVVPKLIEPSDNQGSNVGLWSFVLIMSTVPMCLSSVYKEKALGDTELDPVYMNGWIAVYQLLASFPLLLPSAPASNVEIPVLGTNLWDGARCLAQKNSIEGGSHPDDCAMAPIYVSIYLVFNITYNILIILILKYGSANVLWLAMTITVPVVNLSFAFSFMPNRTHISWEDIVGLVLIMAGLVTYRFYGKVKRAIQNRLNPPEPGKPMVEPKTPGGTVIPATPDTPAGTSTPMLGGMAGHDHHTKPKKRKDINRAGRARREQQEGQQGHSSRYQALE